MQTAAEKIRSPEDEEENKDCDRQRRIRNVRAARSAELFLVPVRRLCFFLLNLCPPQKIVIIATEELGHRPCLT